MEAREAAAEEEIRTRSSIFKETFSDESLPPELEAVNNWTGRVPILIYLFVLFL